MDYDRTGMARDYDRARGYSAGQLEVWLAALSRRVPAAARAVALLNRIDDATDRLVRRSTGFST
jgi:hypothetical protein